MFDLKCKDTDGATFIIEIQNAPQTYFYERGLYYLCRIISSQDEKGDKWKFTLYPVFSSSTSSLAEQTNCALTLYWQIVKPADK